MDYESTFIVSPKLSAKEIEGVTAKVLEIIENSKGIVKTVQQLGIKKLAYSINKFYEGSYVYIEFGGDGLIIKSLENFFKFNDSIMRFLTVKTENKKNVKSNIKQNDKTVDSNIPIRETIEIKQNESAQ
ncbi:MAG: 30S ribosomal protein S6 [Endomicrobium sp.]|nr:30S ribosomal protein S6 [Endomicrobium sp.]